MKVQDFMSYRSVHGPKYVNFVHMKRLLLNVKGRGRIINTITYRTEARITVLIGLSLSHPVYRVNIV
jgi:hypothetical protein